MFNAQFRQFRIGAAGKGTNLFATGQQELDNCFAEESAPARYQGFHLTFSAAQTASFSRKIFAL